MVLVAVFQSQTNLEWEARLLHPANPFSGVDKPNNSHAQGLTGCYRAFHMSGGSQVSINCQDF